MFSIILDSVKFFIDSLDKKAEKDEIHVEKVADTLEKISDILKDTYEKISNDIYPHDNCRILEIFCNQLEGLIKSELSEDNKKLLIDSIRESTNIEKLYYKREDGETLERILISSGDFKSMSILIRLK